MCEVFKPREEMYCMVLEVQLQSVKCTAVTRIRKISSNIFFPLRQCKRLQCADENKPLKKKLNVFSSVYKLFKLLFKLYNTEYRVADQ